MQKKLLKVEKEQNKLQEVDIQKKVREEDAQKRSQQEEALKKLGERRRRSIEEITRRGTQKNSQETESARKHSKFKEEEEALMKLPEGKIWQKAMRSYNQWLVT